MDKRIELIDWLINEATEEQIEGLKEFLINNDVNYGMELILGGKEFDNYINEQAKYIYYEDINHSLSNLVSGDIEGTKKILQEILNK